MRAFFIILAIVAIIAIENSQQAEALTVSPAIIADADCSATPAPLPIPSDGASQYSPDASTLSAWAVFLTSCSGAKYNPSGTPPNIQTQCNTFVRDFAEDMLSHSLQVLAGSANTQISSLRNAANSAGAVLHSPNDSSIAHQWNELDYYATDKQKAFDTAIAAANTGKLVIFGWDSNSATKSGHVAIGVPGSEEGSSKWSGTDGKLTFPMIAQAGDSVFPSNKLTYGFANDKKDGIQIFIFEP